MRTIKYIILTILTLGITVCATVNIVSAQPAPAPAPTPAPAVPKPTVNPDREKIRKCDGSDALKLQSCLKDNPLVSWAQKIVNFLTVGVGVVVVAMVVLGGVQYSMAHDDPGAVARAKKHIYNALFAFVAYVFLFTFLQWMVPGGVL